MTVQHLHHVYNLAIYITHGDITRLHSWSYTKCSRPQQGGVFRHVHVTINRVVKKRKEKDFEESQNPYEKNLWWKLNIFERANFEWAKSWVYPIMMSRISFRNGVQDGTVSNRIIIQVLQSTLRLGFPLFYIHGFQPYYVDVDSTWEYHDTCTIHEVKRNKNLATIFGDQLVLLQCSHK